MSTCRSACSVRRPTMTSSYCASASASLACFGATTLATFSYLSIACTHLHMPSAALEAFFATSGVKAGSLVYFLRIASITCTAVLLDGA